MRNDIATYYGRDIITMIYLQNMRHRNSINKKKNAVTSQGSETSPGPCAKTKYIQHQKSHWAVLCLCDLPLWLARTDIHVPFLPDPDIETKPHGLQDRISGEKVNNPCFQRSDLGMGQTVGMEGRRLRAHLQKLQSHRWPWWLAGFQAKPTYCSEPRTGVSFQTSPWDLEAWPGIFSY